MLNLNTIDHTAGSSSLAFTAPWVTYAFTVAPHSFTLNDVLSLLTVTPGEQVCPLHSQVSELLLARDYSNSCLASSSGACDDATSLSTCDPATEGFYCQYPQGELANLIPQIDAEVADLSANFGLLTTVYALHRMRFLSSFPDSLSESSALELTQILSTLEPSIDDQVEWQYFF